MSTQVSITQLTDVSSRKLSTPTKTHRLPTPSTQNSPPLTCLKDLSPKYLDTVIIYIGKQEPSTCPICMGECLSTELHAVLPCKHEFCSGCLTEYLNVKIEANEVLNIACPQAGCGEVFSDKAIEGVLEAKQYQRYKDLVLKKITLKDPKHKYCPQSGCSRPFKLVETEGFSACECGAKICNTCCGLYHEGKSCMEAIDVDFVMYAKENEVKFCMMCKTIIVKENGCNTIKCAVCDYKWCWLCGNEYDAKHECNGQWSPVPPVAVTMTDMKGRLKKAWIKGSVLKRIGMAIGLLMISPIILLCFVVMFPSLYLVETKMKIKGQGFGKGCLEVMKIGLRSLLFLPITILVLVPLLAFGIFVFPVTYLAESLEKKSEKDPSKKDLETRWQSRDPENFVYRPTNPED